MASRELRNVIDIAAQARSDVGYMISELRENDLEGEDFRDVLRKTAERIGQQHFGVEPRRVGPVVLQVVGRPLKQASDGPVIRFGHGE